jgi:hypothetical protein
MGQAAPIQIAGRAYSPETIALMRSVLDDTWTRLSPLQQIQHPRSLIAERLLQAVADGERDPVMLRTLALAGVVAEAHTGKALSSS